MDDAAIDVYNLVDVLLGDRVLAEDDDADAATIGIVDAVHLAKRREDREDIFPRETGRVSALNGEFQFAAGDPRRIVYNSASRQEIRLLLVRIDILEMFLVWRLMEVCRFLKIVKVF